MLSPAARLHRPRRDAATFSRCTTPRGTERPRVRSSEAISFPRPGDHTRDPARETILSTIAAAALASWSLSPGLLALLVGAGACYARGFARMHRAQPWRFPLWRLGAFVAGLATLWIALASPLDAFSSLLLQVHMLQHLLLMMVAPPLLLLGAPLSPILRGLPGLVRKDALGPFLASPGLQRAARRLVHPMTGWVALAAATWLWHLPAAYELALRSRAWHETEHACFIGAALLFWWPVIEPWPSRSPWPRFAMIPYLVLADLQNTAFSALFTFSTASSYRSYAAAAPRLLGGSALSDQGGAGALMWVLGGMAFLAPVGFLVRELLAPAARRPAPVARRARPVPFVAPARALRSAPSAVCGTLAALPRLPPRSPGSELRARRRRGPGRIPRPADEPHESRGRAAVDLLARLRRRRAPGRREPLLLRLPVHALAGPRATLATGPAPLAPRGCGRSGSPPRCSPSISEPTRCSGSGTTRAPRPGS